jgi:pimeloyl-ACP methyl ester carboxylesterase
MIFRSILGVLVLAICCASKNQNTLHLNKRVEEAAFIKLGEIEQWITIRGENEKAPVLLLLHGGPGDVQSPLTDIYSPYERDFIIVQWDQRGAGKTYEKYKEHTPN